MNLFNDLFKKGTKNQTEVVFIITERLKPWIVLNCLEKENYIITDNRAREIAMTIVKQAISHNVLNRVIHKLGVV